MIRCLMATLTIAAILATTGLALAQGSTQTLQGWVKHVELEGGFWTFHPQGDSQTKYVLTGKLPQNLRHGDKIEVVGEVQPERMGIQMAGTYLEVQEVRVLESDR